MRWKQVFDLLACHQQEHSDEAIGLDGHIVPPSGTSNDGEQVEDPLPLPILTSVVRRFFSTKHNGVIELQPGGTGGVSKVA